MIDDLFIVDPPSGDSSNRIANTRFVATSIVAALSTSQVEFVSGIILSPAAQDYRLIESVPYTATLTNFVAKASSGTTAAALKINAATVTGGIITIAAAQVSSALTTANVMTAGNALVLTLSSVTSALNVSWVVVYNRTLT